MMMENSMDTTLENSSPDFLNYQKEFLDGLVTKGKSTNTIKNYKTDLDCFKYYLRDNVGKITVSQFDLEQTLEYGKYLQKRYSSDNSRRRRVQALRIFFDYLVERGVVPSNPVRKIPSSPKFLDIPRPISFVDLKTLWTYLLEEESSSTDMRSLLAKRNQVIYLLIFGSGLKVSDLAGLREDHITLGDEPRVLLTPKKRDPYTVTLPVLFNDVYANYREALIRMKEKSQIEFNDILFNANPYRILSGSLSPRGLEIVFEELRKKLLISVTPKSLRQACIFKWLKEGHPDSLIKEWMGVAPSYSLKLYKDHQQNYPYSDEFLGELWKHYKTQH